jgi:hypothetical protein
MSAAKRSPGAIAVHQAEVTRDLTVAGPMLQWASSLRAGSAVFGGIDGVPDVFLALGTGQSVARQWTSKASLRIDPDFNERTTLADQLDNFHGVILASPRLQAFLTAHVSALELLPVTLLPVTGKKKLSTEYAVVNVLAHEDAPKHVSGKATLFHVPHVNHQVFATNAFARLVQAEGFSNVVFRDPKP